MSETRLNLNAENLEHFSPVRNLHFCLFFSDVMFKDGCDLLFQISGDVPAVLRAVVEIGCQLR